MALTNTPNGVTKKLGGVDNKVIINSIDFVKQFESNVNRLREALGIMRMQPLTKGNTVNIWGDKVIEPGTTAASGTTGAGTGKAAAGATGTTGADNGVDGVDGIVNPAVDIPLTEVQRNLDRTIELKWHKYRKVVPWETIQQFGYDQAVLQTDRTMMLQIQNDIRKDLFSNLTSLSEATTADVTGNLQTALGAAYGKIMDAFDGNVDQIVMFANPQDAGDYLGSAVIQNGQSVGFGSTLVEDFMGARLLLNNSIPKGQYVATAVNNLNLAYMPANDPELMQALAGKQTTTGELGLITLVHDINTTNATQQSTVMDAIQMFPEISAGVVKGKISASAAATSPSKG